ncbi:MAG: hypothetical protein HZB51_28385 [Chloroflexi bacterium]|nr:hypothetical protein [Chloroflexota bacterium]
MQNSKIPKPSDDGVPFSSLQNYKLTTSASHWRWKTLRSQIRQIMYEQRRNLQYARQFIGKTLAEGGAPVDVLAMNDVKDLSPYSAVVAGSAIRSSK